MSYKKININTALPRKPRARVLIIYTGGTFGMAYDAAGVLIPFDFSLILEQLPTLRGLMLDLTVISFETPIDSSNIDPSHWKLIASIVRDHYDEQDGFVVLHGTDTMAYTASAMSFMLNGLDKPVIFTGAQLPITDPRSDARENLITSLEIAAAMKNGRSIVPEVCIYFDYELLRGNRTRKVESMHFDAFESGNYPPLAKAGVTIDYNHAVILHPGQGTKLEVKDKFDTDVSILKLFPGIRKEVVTAITETQGLKVLVLETFGSGNAPTAGWFIDALASAIKGGVMIVNISQCPGGMVMQGKYETSKALMEIGVIGGADMTTEAAVTKAMLMMGESGTKGFKEAIRNPLAGELTV